MAVVRSTARRASASLVECSITTGVQADAMPGAPKITAAKKTMKVVALNIRRTMA
jgi:hypothetical protein